MKRGFAAIDINVSDSLILSATRSWAHTPCVCPRAGMYSWGVVMGIGEVGFEWFYYFAHVTIKIVVKI